MTVEFEEINLTGQSDTEFKPSVGSGIEVGVSMSVRPIGTVQIEIPTDRIAERPTGSRSLSKQTRD